MNSDNENMISVIDNFWKQCDEASRLGHDIRVERPINGIVFCGVGGSNLPGELIKSYINVPMPVELNRSYKVPAWVDKNTLVFVASYSGNTEEALSCFKSAKSKGAKMVCITSGGKLKEMCETSRTPLILVPAGIQPRMAVGYQTIPLLNVLAASRIIDDQTKELIGTVDTLKKNMKESAQQLAKRVLNKIPVVYTSNKLVSIAKTWKAAFNENAKTQAFFNEFPEMNHNEMIGYTHLRADFYAIFIEDEDDHPRIKKRMTLTKELLNEKKCHVMILKLTGPNLLARIFSSIQFGLYASYYLALEYDVDPTPVVMVESLKKNLGPFSG